MSKKMRYRCWICKEPVEDRGELNLHIGEKHPEVYRGTEEDVLRRVAEAEDRQDRGIYETEKWRIRRIEGDE